MSPTIETTANVFSILDVLIFFSQMVCYNFIAKSPFGLPASNHWFKLSIR